MANEVKEKVLALGDRFQELMAKSRYLQEHLPEQFVLIAVPLDDAQAYRYSLEGLCKALGWEEGGPFVFAFFRGDTLVLVVTPDGVIVPGDGSL